MTLSLTGFTAPWWFLLLLVVAALAVGYVLIQRARKRRTLRFANLDLLERVAPRKQGWWRHAPAAILLVAMLLLTVALAGPTAQEKVPRNRATVMLAIDVSLSMEATDVAPSRAEGRAGGRQAVRRQPARASNLGLVSFARLGHRAGLADHRPRAGRPGHRRPASWRERTATGEAILTALQAIDLFGKALGGPTEAPPARIVLMSDGKQTEPTEDPSGQQGAYTAAQQAQKAGIPVSTISFGTSTGTVDIQGVQEPVPVDDDLLHEVANLSHGTFYKAATADQLKQVYASLGEQIGYTTEQSDASKPWLILGTLLALISAAGSLFIGQRLP